jgi:hypothetical protein
LFVSGIVTYVHSEFDTFGYVSEFWADTVPAQDHYDSAHVYIFNLALFNRKRRHAGTGFLP